MKAVVSRNHVGLSKTRDVQSLVLLYRDFWVEMLDHAHEMLAEIDRLMI